MLIELTWTLLLKFIVIIPKGSVVYVNNKNNEKTIATTTKYSPTHQGVASHISLTKKFGERTLTRHMSTTSAV